MNEFTFTFKALNDTVSFKVASKDSVEGFVMALLSLFPGVDVITKHIEALNYNSKELKASVQTFVDANKARLPQLNAVAAFFNKLPEGDPFFLLPNVFPDLRTDIQLTNYLRSLKEKKDFTELQKPFEELFSDLLTFYDVKSFGEKRMVIGEKDKGKRICRFCKNRRETISFGKKAHAISEALGNKTVVLLEECDQCNEEFSKTIEPDLIEYLAFIRTMFGVKGKGGEKKFKGRNFELEKKDEEKIHLSFEGDDDKGAELPLVIPLKGNQKISLQNVYRTLCKYVLSVIDSKYLPYFDNTIDWINGTHSAERLPLVATMLDVHNIELQPILVMYIRKANDKTIPFCVGEFQFTNYKYVFIVPFSSQDNFDYLDKVTYEKFWKTFKHYEGSTGWKFENFSNDKKKDLVINFSIDYSEEAKKRLKKNG